MSSSSKQTNLAGRKRMSDKNSILKSSAKVNDCSNQPSNVLSRLLDPSGQIQKPIVILDAIVDYRILNGVEQYLVTWTYNSSSHDVRATWESEKTVDSLCREALVKYWAKSLTFRSDHQAADESNSGSPAKKIFSNIKNFTNKLINWALLPVSPSSSNKLETPPPVTSYNKTFSTPPKKRPRQTISDDEGIDSSSSDIDKKSKFTRPKEECDCENVTASSKTFSKCHQIKHSNLQQDSVNFLLENSQSEFGNIIETKPSSKNGRKSFLVAWHYVAYETAETLGINEDQLLQQTLPSEKKFQLQRKKYCRNSPVANSSPKSVTSEAASDISNLSTRPPSSVVSDNISDCSSGSGNKDEYFDAREIVETGSQTDIELDPNVCIYCQSKKGTSQRLSSLRQKKEAESFKEDSSKKKSTELVSVDHPSDDNEVEEDDDDMVDIEYEVENIVGYMLEEGTKVDKYFIKWKGFTAQYNTWEPEDNLTGCDKALLTFYVKRVGERKTLEAEYQKSLTQSRNEGTLSMRKPLVLPPLPPVPDFVMDLLREVAPVTDDEIEMAFKLSKTVKKKTKWTAFKLRKVLMDLLGESFGSKNGGVHVPSSSAQSELPLLRHQILMLEAERRKELIMIDLKDWEKKLNWTAQGKPEIVVENNYDLAGPPVDFTYINDNVIGQNVFFVAETLEGCSCEENCLKDKNCCPGKRGKVMAYNIYRRIRIPPGYPIYECNKRCKCGPECGNRVVQDGTVSLMGTKLCIFRTSNERGWGVKTLKKIKRGTFVCLYAGEIITSEEAENRGKEYEKQLGASYLFDLDYYAEDVEGEDGECPYTIDATRMGNIAHFINHSCNPNLCVFNVWADCVDQNLPKLAFFALRDINRDEELTYDYGSQDDDESKSPVIPPTFQSVVTAALATEPVLLPNGDLDPEDEMAEIDPALLSNLSPAKNRLKLATVSAVRKPCLCGSGNCRKVLF